MIGADAGAVVAVEVFVEQQMVDEKEFLSPYGIRSLSRYHAEHPDVFFAGGQEYRVSYLPTESACLAAIRTGAGRSGCRSML